MRLIFASLILIATALPAAAQSKSDEIRHPPARGACRAKFRNLATCGSSRAKSRCRKESRP